MKGPWDRWSSFLYEHVVAEGIGELYDALVDLSFSSLPPGCRVLDIGCGSGRASVRVARKNPQAKILGLDLSPDQIRWARRRVQGLTNLDFDVGDALNLPLPADRFDIVFSLASIKHWPDPGRGLQQMYRVCKKGGWVYVIEADRDASWKEARDFVSHWKWMVPVTRPIVSLHFLTFVAGQGVRKASLLGLFQSTGFRESYVQKIVGHPFVAALGIK